MGFFQPEYRSGLPFPTPGYPPDPGIKLTSLASPSLAGGFFTTGPPGKPCKHKGHSGMCGSWWNLSPLSLSSTVDSIHFTKWVNDLSLVILYSQDFGATSVMWAYCQFIRTKEGLLCRELCFRCPEIRRWWRVCVVSSGICWGLHRNFTAYCHGLASPFIVLHFPPSPLLGFCPSRPV